MNLDVCRKFESYLWHDSKISSFQIIEREHGEADDISFILDLSMKPSPQYETKKAELIFKDCVFLKADLNLKGKQFCGDDLSGAHCKTESELKESYINNLQSLGVSIAQQERVNLSKIFHFQLIFIQPGGEINILAKDFEIRTLLMAIL